MALLVLLEKWFEMSVTCVRWHGHDSEFFRLIAGVRQDGVLSLFLFAIFVDDVVKKVQSVNTGCYVSHVCTSIFLSADDILISVSSLQKLLSACEEELYLWTCVSMIKSRFVTGM